VLIEFRGLPFSPSSGLGFPFLLDLDLLDLDLLRGAQTSPLPFECEMPLPLLGDLVQEPARKGNKSLLRVSCRFSMVKQTSPTPEDNNTQQQVVQVE